MFLEPIDEHFGRRPEIGGDSPASVSRTLPVGPETVAWASGSPTRSIRPASRRSGAMLDVASHQKAANLRLDEPPLTVRMHDRSGRLVRFASLSMSVRMESDTLVSA